jgi:DNA polymerase
MNSPIVSDTYVPDEGPEEASIVFIGESPGTNEREQKRPFVGDSGQKLESVLLRNGIRRQDVRLANLCHYQPTGNEFAAIESTTYLSEGIKELETYFANRKTKPMVVVPLGVNPLKYLVNPPKPSIRNWRSSIIRSAWKDLEDVKIIPTYHPSAVVRDATLYPIFDYDLRRIASDSLFNEFNLPQREFVIVDKNTLLLEEVTERLLQSSELSVDIENFGPYLACVGFSAEPNAGYCIVWDNSSHTMSCLKRLLESNIPKIFQFGTHDVNFLAMHGFSVNNYAWDTLIAAHAMFPELPKSLAFLTSIYTREPYYKFEGRADDEDGKSWSDKIDRKALWQYNIKDVCCTLEIKRAQEPLINRVPNWKKVFEFELSMLPVAHHIMRSGMRVDNERLTLMRNSVNESIAKNSEMLDSLTNGFLVSSHKKIQKSAVTRNQKIEILYEFLELPARKNHEGGITVDEDALVSLLSLCNNKIIEYKTEEKKQEWRLKLAIITLIMRLNEKEKLRSSYLNCKISTDNRIRSTYKVAGPETGRWAAEKYVDGSGFNSQTVPRGEI